jgi:hypothetical protein
LCFFKGIMDNSSWNNFSCFWDIAQHKVNKLMDWIFTKIKYCVLHHKVNKIKELFKFTKLISLFWVFLNIEPSFANISKARLYNFFKSKYPAWLSSSKLYSANTWLLMLFKFFNSYCFIKSTVKNTVVWHYNITFFTNLNHGANHFILNKQRVKAKVTELFWKFVLWNRHLTKIWDSLGWLCRGESNICRYNILTLIFRFFHCLFHNNLVHCAPKINLNFIKYTGGFNRCPLF